MIRENPAAFFFIFLVLLSLAAWLGVTQFPRFRAQAEALRDEFNVIQGAGLTLLGLIIGFTFSMAVNRYDQRKNCEEEEANAIGTEYVRAELLPAADAAAVQSSLRSYLEQRVLFYTTRDEDTLRRVEARTVDLETRLWAEVRTAAVAQPTPLSALVVSGMNDVLNTQGYAQAAWWNKIPPAAWTLMTAIGVCATFLVGIGSRKAAGFSRVLLILPVMVSTAFFLIADIDSPRQGVIRVAPMNMLNLARSMHGAD